jgi:hypothetical protein
VTRALFLAGALLAISPSASMSAPQIFLAYDDCYNAAAATHAPLDYENACDSNTGLISIVGSFIPPAGINQFEALVATMYLYTSEATLSPWFQFQSGGCRYGKIGADFSFSLAGLTNCADFWQNQANGGMGYTYPAGLLVPAAALIKVIATVGPSLVGPINPGTEYYGFKLQILKALTTGTGSCTGCATPACITWAQANLTQPALPDYIVLPNNPPFVTYNAYAGAPPCPGAVPVRDKTWGALKSLYR